MGTFEVASKFLSIILILGEIAQVPVRTISSLPIHSSEETSILDSTMLLSTEWSSSMTYTSITDWSAPAWSESLSTFTIDINNTKTSDNPPMKTDTESTYVGLDTKASKLKTVASEEISKFDSTVILSTQLSSSMTYTPNIHSSDAAFSSNSKVNLETDETSGYPQNTYTPNSFWSASIQLESLFILTVNINGTESSGFPSLETETTSIIWNETFSKIFSLTSSTSVLLETTYAFTTSGNTESSYFGLESEPSKIQTVSLEETSILESTVILFTQSSPSMTYTPITDWSASARSESLSINITSNETNGNAPIETWTTFIALKETFSAIFPMTSSTSAMLETIVAFSDSKYTESSFSGFDTEASKMQTVSSEETSTLDSTILLSTEWSSSMTYTSITDWSASAWSDSLSTFTIDINNTKTSENPPMKTDTESTYLGLNTESSKIKTLSSEKISTFDSTVILSTKLTSRMTSTPDIIRSASTNGDSLSLFTVNITSTETSGYPSLETETSATVLNETFSKIFSSTSSTSVVIEATSVFTTSGNAESSYFGLVSEPSKIQTVSSEETSILEATVILSSQSSASMTYTPITDWSAPVRSDSLSIDSASIHSNEIGGNAPIETGATSIALNETLSTLFSMTPSTSVMLETTFAFSASTDTKSAFSGLNRDTSKMQTVSAEKKSTFNSTSILSTQLSSSMTYKPIIDWNASAWTDSLSSFMISINNTETSVNPPMTTDTFSILLNETLSDIYYVTPSTSVILQTTFAFSASTYKKPTLSGFNTDTSKMPTVSSEDTPTFKSTVILYTQLSSSITYTPITDWIETTMSGNMSIFTVNTTSTERSGHTPIDTETSSIALDTILSEIVNLTSSTFVRLDTIFVFTTSTDTQSTFSGLNTDTSKMQTVSSEDTSTYNSTVIWSTQLSSSMTYTPSTFRSASTKLDVLSILTVKMTSTETSGYPSLETGTFSTELNQTFSEMFSSTSSTSVALETISALTSSGHTRYVGVNSEPSKMQSASSEETSILESMVILFTHSSPSMTYTPITDWSAYVRSDSLSINTVSITSNETNGNAPIETDTSSLALNETLSKIFSFTSLSSVMLETIFSFSASSDRESTYLGFDTEASTIKTLLPEETYTLDPMSILSTQSSSSMTYISITHWTASAMFESLSVFTTNINNTATSENPAMKTDTESNNLGLKTEASKMKMVSSDETATLDSTVILFTQLSSSMTYTLNRFWSASSTVDSLSIFTVNITSTETSGYPSLETGTSATVLNETFSETFTLASSTSVGLEITSVFTTSGNTEPSYIGLNSKPSKIQTVSSEETSILKSMVILSTQSSPSMTYTPITDLNAPARSDSLSIYTVSITSTEANGNAPIETDTSSIALNETLSAIFYMTQSTSVKLETIIAFTSSAYTESTYIGLDTDTSTMQTGSYEKTSTIKSTSIMSTQWSSSMTYTSITDWSAPAWSESLSTFTIDINNTKTSDNPPMKTDTESTYVGLDTKASKLKTVASEEISKFDSTVILSTQLSSSMTYTPNIHSSDAAFSSNSKVNLETDETSGYPQNTYTPNSFWSASIQLESLFILTVNINGTESSGFPSLETETTSIIWNETFSKIFSLTSSTSVLLETTYAFTTSGNTESSYFGLESEPSKIQTVSLEETSILESTVILFTQSSPSMTYTPITDWSASARSESLSINITSNETNGNAPIETWTTFIALKETFSAIFPMTSSTSAMLETIVAFSDSKYTESSFSGFDTEASKMQTVSSEETSTLDSTILLSTEWSSSMTYTSITDWSASAWSDSLSTFTIDINNTKTSENPPMKTDTESTYLGLNTESSKIKTLSSEKISTFDSTVILSTKLTSRMTSTPDIIRSASTNGDSLSLFTVNITSTETSGYPSLETETSATVLNETFSKIFSSTSSTSVVIEATSVFTTSGNAESSYFGLVSEPSKIQTVSSEETSILEATVILSSQSSASMTYTPITDWSAPVRSDSLSIDSASIHSNEIGGNAPIETGATSIALNETLSTLFSMTPSTSVMLETTFAFSASTDTKSAFSGLNRDTSKMQTVSAEKKSTFNSTSILSTQLSSSMTYKPIIDWNASAWTDSLSSFMISINNTETSVNPPMTTDTFSILLNETLSDIYYVTPSTSVILQTTFAFSASTYKKPTLSGFNTDTSKMPTVSSEDTPTFKSTVILYTQLSSSITYTPITDWIETTMSGNMSIFTVNTTSTERSGHTPIDTETSSIALDTILSEIVNLTSSTFVRLDTIFVFTTSTDTQSTFSGLNTDTSKMQTVSSEDTSTYNSTVIWSTQLSSSMTYTPSTFRSASTKLDVLSILTVKMTSTETSGYPSLETGTFSTELNQTFSEMFSSTSSTSVALETISALTSSGHTRYVGVNSEPSKMQSASSEETSILESMVILFTHSSPSMTYTPITDWSAYVRSDSLSINTVSITSNETNGNAPIETDTSSLALNETLSKIFSFTSLSSVMLETIFSFSASSDRESTYLGFDTEASTIKTLLPEETYTLDPMSILSTQSSSSMTYISITHWTASAMFESLSVFTTNINNTATSENPAMKTDTESNNLGLKTEASKMKMVSSDETATLDSTVILFTQLSSSMTYTLNRFWSASSTVDSLSIFTVNITSTETSGYPSLETGTSATVLNETFSETFTLASSTSVGLEITSVFTTSGNTEPSYIGLNSKPSKIQTVSSEETSILKSMVILSTQSSPSMTYTPITDLNAPARSDSLSIYTVSITSTEANGNAPIETDTSSIALNETLSAIFYMTQSTSVKLETIIAFTSSAYTESTYIGLDTDTSTMQTGSYEKTSTIKSTSIMSTQWSSSMTYTSITDWSAPAWSESLSTFTIDINNTKTSDNPPMKTDTESTYVGLDTKASKLKTVASEEISKFDSTVILSTQLSSSMTYTPNIHSSDAAFSSNSKVNLETDETSGYPQNTYTPNSFWSASIQLESLFILTVNINGTESSGFPSLETETTSIIWNETFSKIFSLTSSTSVLLETTYAFTTSGNTESSYFGLESEPSKIQTVSLEETSILESTVILFTQSSPSMTYTPITDWSASARSESLSINITSNETNGNAPIETWTTFIALKETFSAIFPMTSSTSAMLETIVAFSDSKYTESSFSGFDTEASKMQTVSSEETSTLDSTILLSTEWSSSMTYTSITDWSASAWSDSLSTFTIDINNTKTSENPPMKTDTESTYLGLNTESSKIKTLSSEKISTFDSTVILSTKLTSRMTSTPDIIRSASTNGDSLSLFTVNITSTETSGYPSLETETSATVLNETFSKIFSSTSSTSVVIEATSVFTTSGNAESSYFGLVSEPSKIQTVSSEETSILEATVILSSQSSASMTYTPITDWSAPVRSDSLSIDSASIHSNEIGGNAPIETGATSIALNETLSTLFSMTPSTSVMLETTFAFSASTDTKSAFSGLNRDTSKMQTVSAEKKSTFNSTSILSTQLSSSMTYKPIIDWNASAWTDSLSSFMISINNTETSVNPPMTTDTFSILLNETLSDIYYVTPSTSVILQTTFAFSASTYKKPTLSGFNTDTSKMPTVSSEDTPTFKSTVILYTQLSSSITYTPITDWIETTMSGNMSIFTVNTTSTERSGHTPIDTETSSIALDTILSEIVNLTSSTFVRLDTIFVFTTSTDTQSTFSGLNTDTSKMQTVSSEDTSTYNSTVIWSTQLSSSMTYTPSTFRSASTKLDVLSILTVKMTSTETSGYPSLETGTFSTELNQTFSEMFSSTSSTSVALETISALTSSGHTRYVGVNSEPSKMQSASSEETSILESMVILFTHSSPSMTYTPITDWSAYVRSDSLSINTVSITSNETNGNAPIETDTSSLALNETLSKIFSFTSLSSVMLETIFSFSASSDRESTYLGFDTEASTIKTLLPEETYTLDPMSILSTQSSSSMTYISITHWTASAMFESLSVFTTNINNTATSENPAMKTDTESNNLGLKTEASKMKMVSSDETATLDSTVILFTQLSSSMTYTLNRFWSASSTVDSLSIFTVNITSTETSGYPSLETGTSATVLNETFSETFTLASSTSVGLEITSVFTTSGNTEPSYIGLNSKPSKIQTVSSEETSILKSMVILSTQSSPSMTYTPITDLNAPARSDSLSIYTVSITSTEANGNAPIETDTSSIALNETLSAIFYMTQSTSVKLETIIAFTSSAYTESTYIGLDTDTSTMQTGSYEKTSTIKSTSIMSTQWSSSMTYTSITDWSASVWSDSLSTFTIDINNTETSENPPMTTDTSSILLNETLSEIFYVTPSTSVILQTTFVFPTSTYTKTTFSGVKTDTFKMQTVSSEETSTFDSMVIMYTNLSSSMKYSPITDWIAFTKSDWLSIFTVYITSTESSGYPPIETETSSIALNETLSEIFTMTSSSSVMLETTFSFTTSTDTESTFSGLNTDTSKMQTVSSEETSAFNSTSILSIQLSSSMTYTPINLWSASTKLDVLSILTANINGTDTSGYPSLETETTSIILNETFSKIFSLTPSTSVALETTSAFATLGNTESSYFGLVSEPSKIQMVSLEETSILESTVILSTQSSPNMTYTPTTGLSSFARSDSLSKDTVSINSNEISGNAPKGTEKSSITLNETLSEMFSFTSPTSLMLESTFSFFTSSNRESAYLGLDTETSKMQTVSLEETSTLDSTPILSTQSSSRSGYYTYALQESTQSLLNIRSTISMEETSDFVHLSAASTIKLSVSMMHTYSIDWNVYTTRKNENTPYSPTIPALSSLVSFGVHGISTSSKAPDLGVIIGAVVGCVILLTFAILCLLICSLKRKRRQTRSEDSEDQVAGNVPEPSTSKMNILPLLQPYTETTVPKPMAGKATFALRKWGPLPPITPQLDWMKEIGDSWKKKKKRKHKPEDVQTEEGHDTISPNEDQTGETETGNSNETLGTPDDVISERRQTSKKKKEKGATVDISTGDFTEREPIKNSMQRKEYNLSTDNITDNDETRISSKNSVSGKHTERARESLDIKAETKKKRKKKHRRHGEDRQDEETVHGLNTKSEKKKNKKKRKHEMEMDNLLQKEFEQDSDRKEERKVRKHIKAEEDLLQSESVNDADIKKEKRKKKKKKKHRLDVDKELKDECVDDEVKAKQKNHHVDSEYVFQGESINDVDMTTDLKKYPKDRKGIKNELETESSVRLEKKMEISKNTTTKHENDNEEEHEGEPIDGIDKKPKLERKQKIKQRLDLLDEKTQYESAELGNETQKEGKHDLLQRQNDVERKEESEIVQNAEAMNNDKAKDPTSLGDLATDVRESEVVSSEYVAYRSEKKKKKKKHPSQEIERENTQTINDIVEPDVKRKKRKTRHRAAPMTELDSSDENFIITRNKSHTEGDRGFMTSKHDFERKEESEIVQNAKAMDNDKAKDPASLGDLATDVRESEVVSSEDVAYRSEKKKKKKKKKHPLQEIERENTQTINDIVEPDAKRRKRKKRHRAVPMTELDSSEEDVIRTRNKSHTEGDRGKTGANTKDHIVSLRPDKQSIEDNTLRPITSEINKDIAEIQVKPKIAFVEVERTQGDFVQDSLKVNNEDQNIKTIEGESFA